MLPVLVNKLDDVRRIVDKIYETGNKFTYDFETLGNRPRKLRVAGLGLAWGSKPGQGSYIVTAHNSFITLDWEKVLEIVKPLFEDESMTMIAHNQLFDGTILDIYGVKLHTNSYDTMVMNWLLNTESRNGLKEIVWRIYKYKMNELTEFCGKRKVGWHYPEEIISLDEAPIDVLTNYAVDDVLWTYRLAEDEIAAIKRNPKLDTIYHRLYQRYLPVLSAMQSDGIQINVEGLKDMEKRAAPLIQQYVNNLLDKRVGEDFDPELMVNTNAEIKRLGLEAFLSGPREIREAAIDKDRKLIPELNAKWRKKDHFREFLYTSPHKAHKVYNLKSNSDMNKLLFEEFDITPQGEKTKQGLYKVNAKALVKYQVEDRTGYVTDLLGYRRLQKLHSQYMVGLLPLIDDDHRLRTSFNPALKTGRLSSRQPNLQNIVHDSNFPIRSVFVARPQHKLVVLDYSQMELRILAHYSQDEAMMHGFITKADPHSNTAKRVFNLPCSVEEVDALYPKYRKIAKTINFGVVYGVGARSLVEQIADATKGEVIPTVEEAQGYINRMFEEFPNVELYIKSMKARARKTGLVTTIIGRPRHLPLAMQQEDMKNYYGALRRAANTPIQGTAADIIGIAMCNIRDTLEDMNLWRNGVWLCLQVHDELIFEVREDLAETILPILEDEMKTALKLRVPLDASGGIGDNWVEAK